MTIKQWGGKVSFGLYLYITVHHQKKSGKEMKQGRDLELGDFAGAIEGCCLLTWHPSHNLLGELSYGNQDH